MRHNPGTLRRSTAVRCWLVVVTCIWYRVTVGFLLNGIISEIDRQWKTFRNEASVGIKY